MTRAKRMQENILLLRHRMGLTVPQFASRLGLSENTLRSRCRQPGSFRMDEWWTVERLGDQYGLDLRGARRAG